MKKQVPPGRCGHCDKAVHRTFLSKVLIVLLLIIAIATLPLATQGDQVWGQVKDYLSLVFVPLVTLTTTIVAYYFSNPSSCQQCDCPGNES